MGTDRTFWKNALDQALHVVIFGGLALLHPAIAIVALVVYELTSWKLEVGPVTIGQWPPGNPFVVWRARDGSFVDQTSLADNIVRTPEKVTQLSRVEDLRLDLWFSLLAIAVASVIAGGSDEPVDVGQVEPVYQELATLRDGNLLDFHGLNVDPPVGGIVIKDNVWKNDDWFIEDEGKITILDSPDRQYIVRDRPPFCSGGFHVKGVSSEFVEQIFRACGLEPAP